jgi:hypothetical protein
MGFPILLTLLPFTGSMQEVHFFVAMVNIGWVCPICRNAQGRNLATCSNQPQPPEFK